MNNILTRILENFDPGVSPIAKILNWVVPITPFIIIDITWARATIKPLKLIDLISFNFIRYFKIKFTVIVGILISVSVISWNFIGLVPYVFSTTRHPSISFSLAILVVLITWINISITNSRNTLIHLVPKEAPLALIIPLVIIETIRLLIRPITLGLRLTANIMAGHIIITLASQLTETFIISKWLPFTIPPNIILVIIETIVTVVQAYIIALLLLLYLEERS